MVDKVLIINEISTLMGAETGTIKTLKILCISWLRTTHPPTEGMPGQAGHDEKGLGMTPGGPRQTI